MQPMKLFRHKNKTFYIHYSRAEKPPNGTNISLKKIVGYPVTDEKKAKEILSILTQEWHKSKIAELDKSNRITLDDFRIEYTAGQRADLSDDTLRLDDLALRLLADTCGPTRAIRAIDQNDLIKFKAVCVGRKLSPNSIKTYFRHIKAALSFAHDTGYRGQIPKFPKVKTSKPIPRVIDPDAINAILQWAEQNDIETWRYASFSLWTGCRLSEIRNLRWQDVQIYNAVGQPSVAANSNSAPAILGQAVVTGKGDKQRTIYLIAPAIESMLPVGQPSVAAVFSSPSSQMGASFGLQPSAYQPSPPIPRIGRIFHPWIPTTISKKFKHAARSAGHPDAHFHCLRHTAATMMITAGIPMHIVQMILGHADIRTTLVYAKVLDNVIKKEMGKLANLHREK